ncbi:MAG TPA: heme ABC transporter ATP-binding protein [Candidatus Methanofastidiosa archaeon]|nr:heme ABC transporter ATP-binding protein [Candidatus Methanofastidiosa archaeon]HPR41252.1 heme ABC transporter ATP-binding protein [Candidatus Methanofastidiosa archaeon]
MDLNVESLYFGYFKKNILKDVSFTAKSGEVMGIVGPNGSGKTTLLKCIRKALTPRQGSIMLDGEDIMEWDRTKIAKYFGVVPQNTNITFPFTVLEIVMMGRIPHLKRMQGEGEDDVYVAKKAMSLTAIEHLYYRYVNNLSGGEVQRVIIARALAQEPKILLLDEPTSNLDINHQFETMKLIRKLAKDEDMIVVIISHDLNLSMRYCDNLILLHDGEVFSSGRPVDVLTKENIRKVYGVEAQIDFNTAIDSNQITLIDIVE